MMDESTTYFEGELNNTQSSGNSKPTTVEDQYNTVMSRAGRNGCGIFQVLVCAAVMGGTSQFSWLFYGLGFLELMPQFDCTYPNGTVVYDCVKEQICQGQKTAQLDYVVNYTNATSLHNWVEQYDLVCTDDFQIGLIGSMFFVGWCVTLLIVPLISDKKGRKWIFLVSVVIMASSMVVMTFTSSLTAVFIFMFIAGMG